MNPIIEYILVFLIGLWALFQVYKRYVSKRAPSCRCSGSATCSRSTKNSCPP